MTIQDLFSGFYNQMLIPFAFVIVMGFIFGRLLGLFKALKNVFVFIKLVGYSILLYAFLKFYKIDTKLDGITFFTVFVCTAEIISNLLELLSDPIKNLSKYFSEKKKYKESYENSTKRFLYDSNKIIEFSNSVFDASEDIYNNIDSKNHNLKCSKCNTKLTPKNLNVIDFKHNYIYPFETYVMFVCPTCGFMEYYSANKCGLEVIGSKCYVTKNIVKL
jgi:hypothetical protein